MGERLVVGPAPRRKLPARSLLKAAALLLLVVVVGARLLIVELVSVMGNTMAPNVLEGDVLMVMRRAAPRLGDVVLVENGDRAVLRRVLALPGDSVAAVEGVLVRNDIPLETRIGGNFAYHDGTGEDADRPRRQQLFFEHLEDRRTHAALGDHVGAARPWALELPRIEVPSGHIFVLCDNRRVCPLDELAGVVPRAWVKGVARYAMWFGDARVEAPPDRPLWGAFVRLESQEPAGQ